jgi:PAS domain S-box-containing protein
MFLGGMIIMSNYTKILSLEKLNEKVIFSNLISSTLHSLQKERGLSSGYVTGQIDKFKYDLMLQRKKSDLEIAKLVKYLKNISSENFQILSKKKLFKIRDLNHIRSSVINYTISAKELIRGYSLINASLLDIILSVAKSSHVPIVTQNILSYTHFLYLKENIGIERAKGVAILATKDSTIDSLIDFTNLLAIQKQNEMMYLSFASIEMKKYYYKISKENIFNQIKVMEQDIIHKRYLKNKIDSKHWYNKITKKLELFDKIGKNIKVETIQTINSELKSAKNIFILVILLTVLSFVIFILMLIAFLKITKEESRLRAVMDKYIISSVTDLKGIIIDVSQAFCNISGYSKDELIGKNHNIIRHPDMPKRAFKELWQTIKSGNAWSGKVKNLKKDGGFYWVFANIEPLYNAKGEIDSYMSIRLDITENELLTLKILEEEKKNIIQEKLMQQQHRLAQMGEMISMIAHQWRQPLSAITAAAGSLSIKAKREKLDTDTAIKITSKIEKFSIHLSKTIDDFRDFFKTNKKKSVTNYKNLLDGVLLIIEDSLSINNIKFIQNINSIKEFDTYENEVKQVLLNLMKNSEDALLENSIQEPWIKVEIDKNVLTVEDNAGGIKEEIMDKIFEPYFSTKLQKDGTGLGLYMSKLIIENHCAGKLSVQNSKSGAIFKIVLGDDDD